MYLHIPHVHFKMDSLKEVVQLNQPDCFFVICDCKDAYSSVYVRPEDRKWLKFFWRSTFLITVCHKA